jgi:hypothetical protein
MCQQVDVGTDYDDRTGNHERKERPQASSYSTPMLFFAGIVPVTPTGNPDPIAEIVSLLDPRRIPYTYLLV